MLPELVTVQRDSLMQFYEQLSLQELETLLQTLYACRGLIFCTGVGKSAFVAQKVAATMASTGTRAIFLSSTDALHGDLGMVCPGDVVLFFSKSGESDELISLVPYLRNKGALLTALVNSPKSRLADACSVVLHLANIREICPFDMAPTTSSVTQMLVGDLLAIALMQMHRFGKEDFARNHPAGRLGKRMSIYVRDLMWTGAKIPTCRPLDRLIDVIEQFSSKACGCMLVLDQEGRLCGIFTDGDLRRSLQREGSAVLEMTMQALMTVNPRVMRPDILVWDAMREMEATETRGAITVMPVLDEERHLVGLLRMHDIIQLGL